MHSVALSLAPVLGAEKSKVPYYIAGGVLVAWAFIVSVGFGLRLEAFPATRTGERAVIAVSAVLVLVTISTAVITAGTPAKAGAAKSAPPPAASGGATTSLQLAANPSGLLKYDTSSLRAKAGTVSITMSNMSSLEHNVTVAQGNTVLGATPTFIGGTKTLTLSLKPGKYTFFCSVPGHRQAGMEGTLTVS